MICPQEREKNRHTSSSKRSCQTKESFHGDYDGVGPPPEFPSIHSSDLGNINTNPVKE